MVHIYIYIFNPHNSEIHDWIFNKSLRSINLNQVMFHSRKGLWENSGGHQSGDFKFRLKCRFCFHDGRFWRMMFIGGVLGCFMGLMGLGFLNLTDEVRKIPCEDLPFYQISLEFKPAATKKVDQQWGIRLSWRFWRIWRSSLLDSDSSRWWLHCRRDSLAV